MASKTAKAMDTLARALGDEAEGCDIEELAEKVVAKLRKSQSGINELAGKLHQANLLNERLQRDSQAKVE